MNLSTLANRALAIKLVAAFTTYGFTILLARLMAPEEFGKIAFFLNLSLVLSVIGARGQQLAALRHIPPMLEVNDRSGLMAFTKWAARRAVLATLAIFLIILTLALVAQRTGALANHTFTQLTLGLALIPLVGWIDLQSHFARGYHFLALSLVPKEILWRGTTGAAILLVVLAFGHVTISATTVLAILVASLITIAALQALVLRRKTTRPTSHTKPITPADWQSSGTSFWVTSVSNIFLANADVILVGLFAGTKAAGIYFAANRLAMLLAFFLTSTNLVLAPLLAKESHTTARHQIASITHHATRKITLPTLALGVIMATFAPQLLHLFGPEFVPAATALRILILAAVINAASGPADIVLNMCGFHKNAMRASAATLAVSAALLAIGAASGSVDGIAWAVLAATTVRKTVFWRLALTKLAIRTDLLAALSSRNTVALHP